MFVDYGHPELRITALTPTERLLVDPTGKGMESIRRMTDSSPTPMPAYARHIRRSEWLDLYLAARNKRKLHAAYIEFDDMHVAKYAPQGGHFSLNEVHAHYESSYSLAQRSVAFKWSIAGRDFLLRKIRDAISKYGYPQIGYEVGITGTSGALPTMQPKGSFLTECVNMSQFRHVFPNLPGQRIQRTKHRTINQDSCQNVRYIEGILNAVRKWLVKYLPEHFGAWLNPTKHVHPTITKHVSSNSYSVETDFKACDDHYSLEVLMECVLPIYEALIPNKVEFTRFAAFLEELFYQPVYMGNYMMTGKHNLFSGQSITSDIETIYDCENELGALIRALLDPEAYDTLNLGDDIALLGFKKESMAQKVMDYMVEEGQLNGFEYSLDKCAVNRGVVHFLRRVYAPGLGKIHYNEEGKPFLYGAYPGVLTLNSIVNPERADSNDPVESVRALLQRLDNLQGNPDASGIIGLIVSKIKISTKLHDIRETERANYYDWWDRVYGESWTFDSSYSWKVLQQLSLTSKLAY